MFFRGHRVGGGAPLALGSYRLPISALSLFRDVLHSGEISWTMGWRQTAAALLLAAGVRVTAILQPLVRAAQLLPLSILKGSMDGANSYRQIQAVVASAGLWGCETQVQGIASREAPTPRIQKIGRAHV